MNEQDGVIDTAFNILVKVISKASKVDLGDPNIVSTLHDIIHSLIG